MSNAFLDTKPRRGPRVVLVAAALVAIIGLVAVLAFAVGRSSSSRATTRSAGAVAPQSPPLSMAPSSTPSGRTVTLVQGSTLLNGLYVGFPHTTVGAISAAAEYWTAIGSTLDPDRAAAIGRAVADPSWTSAASDLAQGPVNSRKHLSLPAQGQLPPGSSMELTVEEYQLLPASKSDVEVLLLGYMTTTTSEGTQSRVGVFPIQLRWDDDDWKLLRGTDVNDYSNLSALPGSSAAAGLGWLPINH